MRATKEIEKVIKKLKFCQFMDNDILAEYFNLQIIEVDFEVNISMKYNNYILVKQGLSNSELREIVLHEIGHDLRHDGSCPYNHYQYSIYEAQADKIMLLLALPTKFILMDLKSNMNIYEISEKYNVSIELVQKRLELIYYEEIEKGVLATQYVY